MCSSPLSVTPSRPPAHPHPARTSSATVQTAHGRKYSNQYTVRRIYNYGAVAGVHSTPSAHRSLDQGSNPKVRPLLTQPLVHATERPPHRAQAQAVDRGSWPATERTRTHQTIPRPAGFPPFAQQLPYPPPGRGKCGVKAKSAALTLCGATRFARP